MRLPSGERKVMRKFLKGRKPTRKSQEAAYRVGFIRGVQSLFNAITKEKPRGKAPQEAP